MLLDVVVAVAVAVAGKKTVGVVAEITLLPPSFSSPLLFGVWSAGRDASSDALGPPAWPPAPPELPPDLPAPSPETPEVELTPPLLHPDPSVPAAVRLPHLQPQLSPSAPPRDVLETSSPRPASLGGGSSLHMKACRHTPGPLRDFPVPGCRRCPPRTGRRRLNPGCTRHTGPSVFSRRTTSP